MSSERLISITFIITLFLFGMLFQIQEVLAQNLRICDSGLELCEKFIEDKDKYKQCLARECNQKKTKIRNYFEITEKLDNIEYIETCDYGARRCETLENNKLAYWECMKDSCVNQPMQYDPTCKAGQKQCTAELAVFNKCARFNCPNPAGKVQYCSASKRKCHSKLKRYWQCVYKGCLGDVNRYKENIVRRKYIRIKDENGNIVKIRIDKEPTTLTGVKDSMANPKSGINREEWVREIPSEYLVTGNPSNYLRCFRSYAIINCKTQDIRSCRCSDGTVPIFKRGAPREISPEQWER